MTPALFEKYPTAAGFGAADLTELAEVIHPTGFYRQKTRYLQDACRILMLEHGSEVPAHMESLLKMQGVSRKTASVVFGVAFGIGDGIVVDTHVKRLALRLRPPDP